MVSFLEDFLILALDFPIAGAHKTYRSVNFYVLPSGFEMIFNIGACLLFWQVSHILGWPNRRPPYLEWVDDLCAPTYSTHPEVKFQSETIISKLTHPTRYILGPFFIVVSFEKNDLSIRINLSNSDGSRHLKKSVSINTVRLLYCKYTRN